jgi:hypothetical protein
MESGKEDLDMELERCRGKMGLHMKENGYLEKRMEKENSYIQKAKFMKENGIMIEHMGVVLITVQMEQNMKEIGKMTFKMVKELRHGLMVQSLQATTSKVKRME